MRTCEHAGDFCKFVYMLYVCLGLKTRDQLMQVAKATVSWLMGIYDPFEDINVIAATAAEHESLGLSNESSNVTNGTWGVRHLCVYCCFTFAALMASVKVMS